MALPAILMAAGLAAQAGSMAGIGKTDPRYDQTNPLTDQYYADILSQLQNYQGQQAALGQQSQQALQQSQSIGSQMGQTQQQIAGQQAPGAMEWFQNFLQTVPEYREIAQGTSEQFTEVMGRNLQQQQAQLQSQAVENAASQFGGRAYSGAAQQAVGQAAAQPLAQSQNQLGQAQSQMANQTFNNLAGAGQNLAYQGTQAEFTNTLNQLGQILAAQQAQAGIAQGAASGYTQQGNQLTSLLNALQGARADVAQPVYQAIPGADPLNELSSLLMGGAGLANVFGSNTALPAQGATQIPQSRAGIPTNVQQYMNY